MLKKITLIMGLMLTTPCAAFADDDDGPNWNYGDITTGVTSTKLTDVKFNNYRLTGAVEINDYLFVAGGYDYSKDNKDLNITNTGYQLSGGLRHALTERLHGFVTVGYSGVETEVDMVSTSISGFTVEAGVRARVIPIIEAGASIAYSDFGDDGNTTEYRGYAMFLLGDHMGIRATVTKEGDNKTFGGGLRFNF